MKRWPTKPLGELCEFRHGNTPSKAEPNYWGGSFPWVSPKDMHVETIVDTEDHLTTEAIADDRATIAKKHSLLVVVRSGILAHTLPVAIAGRDVAFNQDLKALRVISQSVTPRYLFRFLQASSAQVLTRGTKRGATVHSLQSGFLESLLTPVPPLAEQERIVKLLDEADELRKLRAQADRRTGALLPALFHEMFGDSLTNLRGWPTKELRHLGRVVTGSTPPSAKEGMFGVGIPFITPGDLESNTRETMRYVTEAGAAEVRTVRAGSTLVCCIGATIGKTDRAWKPSAFNQQINAVEWSNEIDDDFGVVCLKRSSKAVIQQGSQTALPILKKSLFEQIRIPVPPLPLQKEFAQRVAEIREVESAQAASRQRLESLFQSLLHRAFNGEL